MTERLADIAERIDNVHQLDAVVTVMRGIAAARAQQSRSLIAGIAAYTQTVSHAIGQALAMAPAPGPLRASSPEQRGLVLFGAEQGFAGAFSDRIFDWAQEEAADGFASAKILLVGTRAANIAAERGISPVWTTAMANQIGNVTEVANRVADALYARIARGEIVAVDLFYSRIGADRTLRIENVPLLPLKLERFQAKAVAIPPLVTLDPAILLAGLAEEYIYARLCEAAMHSFAAENETRMQSMRSAGDNIAKTLNELEQRERHVRQEAVTAEIIELAAGVEAQHRFRR